MLKPVKPVEALTQQERFLIALSAGVPIKETVTTAQGRTKIVLYPSSITIVNGEYVVAVKKS